MEVMTANMGWCFGIERAYQLIHDNAPEVVDGPVFAAHRTPPADLDTLHRIETRDQRLLETYPGLDRVTVIEDASQLKKGDNLLLGFHGLPKEEKEGLVASRYYFLPWLKPGPSTAMDPILLANPGMPMIAPFWGPRSDAAAGQPLGVEIVP